MATLWRGIVGADLVVYVTGKAGGSVQSGEEAVGSSGVVAGAGTGSVEVRSSGLVVVKVPVVVGGQGQGQEVVVDKKMERRLGFEVVEWVRGSGWVNASREAQMHGMEY
jgi:HMG box factor